MLNTKVIHERFDWVKEKLTTRGIKPEELDEVVAIDEKCRARLSETEALKTKRNKVSKEIVNRKRSKENADNAVKAMRGASE